MRREVSARLIIIKAAVRFSVNVAFEGCTLKIVDDLILAPEYVI